MVIEPPLLQLAADWCINLSAGWFAAAVIIPALSKDEQSKQLQQVVILENMLFAVAFFGLAYILEIYDGR